MLFPPLKILSQRSKMPSPSKFTSKASRLSQTEWRRRVWHASPGVLPFLLWAVPHRDPISPTLQGIMILFVCGLAANVFWRYRQIQRADDRERVSAVLGYALSVLVSLLVFPQHAQIGLTVLAVLAFGDGSATLGGLLIGGPKLPWNSRKTWSGLGSFLLVGIPLASLIYWGETQFNPESLEYQRVPFSTALSCATVAVTFAGIAESLPMRINDNIRVGLAAAIGVTTMHAWLLGL